MIQAQKQAGGEPAGKRCPRLVEEITDLPQPDLEERQNHLFVEAQRREGQGRQSPLGLAVTDDRFLAVAGDGPGEAGG